MRGGYRAVIILLKFTLLGEFAFSASLFTSSWCGTSLRRRFGGDSGGEFIVVFWKLAESAFAIIARALARITRNGLAKIAQKCHSTTLRSIFEEAFDFFK